MNKTVFFEKQTSKTLAKTLILEHLKYYFKVSFTKSFVCNNKKHFLCHLFN